jgi:putative oxidoreductase
MKRILFNPGNHSLASSIGLLFLRLGVGLIMLLGHGWGKAQMVFSGASEFPDPLGIGAVPSLYLVAFAEFVCAGLIVIGFMTRLATIPLVVTMLVAAFVAHADDPWFMANAVAGEGSKELALLFLAGFAALVFTGPGRYSADGLLVLRKRKVN